MRTLRPTGILMPSWFQSFLLEFPRYTSIARVRKPRDQMAGITKAFAQRPRWADMMEDSDEDVDIMKNLPKIHQAATEESVALNLKAVTSSRDIEEIQESSVDGKIQKDPRDSVGPLVKPQKQTLHVAREPQEPHGDWMWILEPFDPAIHVVHMGRQRIAFEKNEEVRYLRAAKVAQRVQATPCVECGQLAPVHHKSCSYRGQIPCDWCTRLLCKHGGKCSRKNFGCKHCHYYETGHCILNHGDVRRFNLTFSGP